MPTIRVIEDRCKGCGYCIGFCPKGCLKTSDRINPNSINIPTAVDPERCTGCKTCENICPDLALYVELVDLNGGQK